MAQEIDILKIVKEDILRIIYEVKNRRISLRSIELEINVSNTFISKAVSELESENLISLKGNFVKLREKGQEKAEDIAKRHFSTKNYFRKSKNINEAHKAADVFEHYISEEVANNIRKLSTLKESGISLIKFGLNKEGLIADIMLKDSKLLERIISMGIFLEKK